MRFRVITSQAALIAILQFASPIAYISARAQQLSSHRSSGQETDHVRLSTPLIKAWREIRVGSPVYALDDAAEKKDWLPLALIQHIETQTGIWHIWTEPGYSVFRIYPYLSNRSPQPSVYQGIVVKVNGTLSEPDFLAAIRNRTPTIRIDEYDVFGAKNLSVQRYSRLRGKGGV